LEYSRRKAHQIELGVSGSAIDPEHKEQLKQKSMVYMTVACAIFQVGRAAGLIHQQPRMVTVAGNGIHLTS
jgi:hypothetical protein